MASADRVGHVPPSNVPSVVRDDPSSAGSPEAFLDILSHELRTPVTTIYAGAQILATRELTTEAREALAGDVRLEADRLYRLVEDLVMLARAERDVIRPVGEPVAVRHLVAAAIEREAFRHPETEIRLLGASDAAAGEADEVMVTHVIRNLLDNAVRRTGATAPIEVIVEVTGTEVQVRVVDHGWPPAADSEPFKLTSRPAVVPDGRPGAGIGLHVASRLVRAMHGRIWAGPAEGSGTEFGFALARFAGAPSPGA